MILPALALAVSVELHGREAPAVKGLTAISVSTGNYACALRADGSPLCWGDNTDWALSPPEGERFSAISAGRDYACAIRIGDGSPVCWGSDDYGQTSPPGISRLQTTLPPDERFTAVSAGFIGVCALREDGSPVCVENGVDAIRRAGSKERFVAISVGTLATCGLRQDGSPVCWTLDLDGIGLGAIDPLDPRSRKANVSRRSAAATSMRAASVRTVRHTAG